MTSERERCNTEKVSKIESWPKGKAAITVMIEMIDFSITNILEIVR